MGKYDAIIDDLQTWEHDDPKRRELIAEKIAELKGEPDFKGDALGLAELYREARVEKDVYKELLGEAQIKIEAIEKMLQEQYEVEGVRIRYFPNGGSVGIQPAPHAKVVDRDANRKWAIKEGLERDLMLPWQTLNAITSKRVLAGEPEPDGVEVTAKWKVVLRKD